MTFKSLMLGAMALTCGLGASAQTSDITTLDLSKAHTTLTFDSINGMWTGTYDDEAATLDSQLFCFLHNSYSDYNTWWGFTASNSANNKPSDNYITHQFSSMAKGGIALNEDGSIKLNANGAPEVSAAMPYMVGYYGAYFGKRPTDMVLSDGEAHEVLGCYVSLNTWTYYTVLFGDVASRAFTEADSLTLTIHGVHADETEAKVEVPLASYSNGRLNAATGWSYVDLTPLGAVNELYFTVDGTDKGAYGLNTPAYFCLDKLQVRTAPNASVANAAADSRNLSYDRAGQRILAADGSFVALYNTAGQLAASSENGRIDVSGMTPGVYVARSGAQSIKIAIR